MDSVVYLPIAGQSDFLVPAARGPFAVVVEFGGGLAFDGEAEAGVDGGGGGAGESEGFG